MIKHYQALAERKRVVYSLDQVEIIKEMLKVTPRARGWWRSSRAGRGGIYLYGNVGRGKSLLMNLYYTHFKQAKKKVHFHDLMSTLHARVATEESKSALEGFVESFAKHLKLLCIDEFHIKDIADAMLAFKLLELFFKYKIFLFFTSNYHPDELYQEGINQANFSPAIALIKKNMKIICAEGKVDYRRLGKTPRYFIGKDSEVQLEQLFFKWLKGNIAVSRALDFGHGRSLKIGRCADEIAWLDYQHLQSQNLGASDYKILGQSFKVIFLAAIKPFEGENELRRFMIMIDQWYECRVKLVYSAEKEIGSFSDSYEFQRTLSRMCAMNSY